MALHWTWQFVTGSEPAITPMAISNEAPSSFSTQSEAENWIGAHWRELLQQGVRSVILCRNGTQFTEPMSFPVGS